MLSFVAWCLLNWCLIRTDSATTARTQPGRALEAWWTGGACPMLPVCLIPGYSAAFGIRRARFLQQHTWSSYPPCQTSSPVLLTRLNGQRSRTSRKISGTDVVSETYAVWIGVFFNRRTEHGECLLVFVHSIGSEHALCEWSTIGARLFSICRKRFVFWERETGIEPATSSLGIWTSFVYREHMRQRRLSCSFALMAFQRFASSPGLMQ